MSAIKPESEEREVRAIRKKEGMDGNGWMDGKRRKRQVAVLGTAQGTRYGTVT